MTIGNVPRSNVGIFYDWVALNFSADKNRVACCPRNVFEMSINPSNACGCRYVTPHTTAGQLNVKKKLDNKKLNHSSPTGWCVP